MPPSCLPLCISGHRKQSMLPSSLSAELDDPFQGMALTSSLDPVLDNQQIGGSTEVAGFKRTPARQAAARRAGGTQRAAAAGQENSLLDVPLHRQSSLTVRPPLVERSSNIQFCSGLSSKTANKLDLRGTTPAATTINLNASRRLERRLAFERTLPYNALEPAVPAAEYQHAATTDKIPSPEAMFVPPVKTFAQVTKNNPDYASPSNCAADVKPGYSCLYPATDAEAVALSNTGFSLWSNSRLPPAYIPTGPLPRPIQHHAPPSVTSQGAEGPNKDATESFPTEALTDPETFACWCHVQSSQHKEPIPVNSGVVRSLIEQQVQSAQPYRAPWYRHQPRSLPPKPRPSDRQTVSEHQVWPVVLQCLSTLD